MALWAEKVGRISPDQTLEAQNALICMHAHFKLTLQQIREMITHIASDADARKYWGTRKSPSGWLKRGEDAVYTWEKIAAHAESGNDGLEEGEISFAATIARFK